MRFDRSSIQFLFQNIKGKKMQVSNINKKEKGFTLLEIMVVIVILGVLASMIVPNLLVTKIRQIVRKSFPMSLH